MDNPTFNGADKLWNKFQENLHKMVNDNSGISEINTDYISRPNWEQYKKVIKGLAPISSLPNFNGNCN